MLISLDCLLKSKMLIVRGLTRKLDVEVANNGRGREIRFRQVGTHTDDRKFCSLRYLNHVKIAVAISGVEGFDLRSDQEIALSGMAHAFTEC